MMTRTRLARLRRLLLLAVALGGIGATVAGPPRAGSAAIHPDVGARNISPLAPSPGGSDVASAPISLRWLRVDPADPRTLLLGGTGYCRASLSGCANLLLRSTDGGATWGDLRRTLGGYDYGGTSLATLVLAAGGHHAYVGESAAGNAPATGGTTFAFSVDGGLHWRYPSGCDNGYGGGYISPTPSLASARRVYAVCDTGYGNTAGVFRSDDAGLRVVPGGDPSKVVPDTLPKLGTSVYRPWGGLVADPRCPDTLYANVTTYDGNRPAFAARSDDAGAHWGLVVTPTVSPPLRTFTVETDPHEGGLLVGRTADPGVPADRRYLSSDEGRTWRAAACPGDLRGVCPALTVDNAFGAGASYAFVGDGVYRFHGGGPAEARLATSGRLPARAADIVGGGGGARAGDPVYLLARGVRGDVGGVLYRTTDGGATWRELRGILPTLEAPSRAPGTLYVPASHHSVAAPFVATYRRLGRYTLGDPITEAYREGDTLTQDFDRMRLELRGGRVAVADLGRQVFFARPEAEREGPHQDFVDPNASQKLGDYWAAHGGSRVFGEPLNTYNSLGNAGNGDESGRTYDLVWYDNARLELHPENRDPRFAVLVGLLGREALGAQGWMPGASIETSCTPDAATSATPASTRWTWNSGSACTAGTRRRTARAG